jgi:hypothetical protein
MKISELIEKLSAAKEKYGDVPVVLWDEYRDPDPLRDAKGLSYWEDGNAIEITTYENDVMSMENLTCMYKVPGEIPDPKGKEYYHCPEDDPNSSFFDIWQTEKEKK